MTEGASRDVSVPSSSGRAGHDEAGRLPGKGGPVVLPPEVKICGLTRREDAELAAESGAGYLGVVLVQGTPRALSVSQGREVTRGLDVPVVVVMADPGLVEAMKAGAGVGASVIQLHGEETPEQVKALKDEAPWRIWKALRVKDRRTLLADVERFSGLVDGILLDSWHPIRRGGTGRTFSWADVEAVRSEFPTGLALIAAGGLTPGNVGDAIRRLRPHVVDVSSGVEERPGIKRASDVVAFIRAARGMGKEGH